jgi:multiple sugar transport system permease protein
MAVALLMNRDMRGIKVIRTLMLTPWIVPSFVVAVLWQYMWQSDIGIINKVLVDYTGLLGHRPVWLIGDNSLWAIIIPSIWRGLPFAMLIFLAGLQAMPQELHEAAAIDGAGAFHRFRRITLPLLRPSIFLAFVIGMLNSITSFDLVYVMTNGGPGHATEILVTYIYKLGFVQTKFDDAAAVTMVFFVLLIATAAAANRLAGGNVGAADTE